MIEHFDIEEEDPSFISLENDKDIFENNDQLIWQKEYKDISKDTLNSNEENLILKEN